MSELSCTYVVCIQQKKSRKNLHIFDQSEIKQILQKSELVVVPTAKVMLSLQSQVRQAC